MSDHFIEHLTKELEDLKNTGLYKTERVITSPQSGTVVLDNGRSIINLCANNYLGLSNHADMLASAHEAIDRYCYGMSSVQLICGTQEEHKQLEASFEFFGAGRHHSVFQLL